MWHDFFRELRDELAKNWSHRQEKLLDHYCEIRKRHGLETSTWWEQGKISSLDPFSVFNQFLRSHQLDIAVDLSNTLGLKFPVEFDPTGIPRDNQYFFWSGSKTPKLYDVNVNLLWKVFDATLDFVNQNGSDDARKKFAQAFDACVTRDGMQRQLSKGLFWMFPDRFVPLGNKSRDYIWKNTSQPFFSGSWTTGIGERYLVFCEQLKQDLEQRGIEEHPFSVLTACALRNLPLPTPPYTIDSLLGEGCFLSKLEISDTLSTWTAKKNIILQGPPGTGKTWLAKRLAKVLLSSSQVQQSDQLQAIQFHANTSYEDFVQGYRPSTKGLVLEDGSFLKFIQRASKNPEQKFVFVIEEVNRGTPAQIFGELLTLLEEDKRDASEALKLSYSDDKVHIPKNLFVIGTMNTADRSLAVMDFALRRRFAFVNLTPCLNNQWMKWCLKQWNDEADWAEIKERIEKVNNWIENDPLLGRHFAIGHSFVTPNHKFDSQADVQTWYNRVVSTEIVPLVCEYWFDDEEKRAKAAVVLFEGSN